MNDDIQKLIDVTVALERQQCAAQYLEIMRDAVSEARAKEREACARLCDLYRQDSIATSIRARSNDEH